MTILSKDSVQFLCVDDEFAGQRVDNYLFRLLKGVPKSHVQRIIRSGEIRLNKKRCKGLDRLQGGDILRIPPIKIAKRESHDEIKAAMPKNFEIIFEDDYLLVINKISGMAVHGGSGVDFGVIESLRNARPEAKYLELVHRLDKDTSGLLMIAKKRNALVRLHEDMREGKLQKRYLAMGVGKWSEKTTQVKCRLLKYTGANGEKMVRVTDEAEGQLSHTLFRLRGVFSGSILHQVGVSALSLVEATLKTGRTHQIRVHMQSQNCPIAGDERYGDYQANRRLQKIGLKRMFLHASFLKLKHPIGGEDLVLEAPLPLGLQKVIALLEDSSDIH